MHATNDALRRSTQYLLDFEEKPRVIMTEGQINIGETIKLLAIDPQEMVIATMGTIGGMVRMRLMAESSSGRVLE